MRANVMALFGLMHGKKLCFYLYNSLNLLSVSVFRISFFFSFDKSEGSLIRCSLVRAIDVNFLVTRFRLYIHIWFLVLVLGAGSWIMLFYFTFSQLNFFYLSYLTLLPISLLTIIIFVITFNIKCEKHYSFLIFSNG